MMGAIVPGMAGVVSAVFEHLHPVYYVFVPYWGLILTALVVSPFTILLPQLLQGKLTWPRREDAPDEWVIHGKKYNLRPFYDNHPGGSFVLRAAKGSDCTGLVESYHLFLERDVFMNMLSRFLIKEEPQAPPPSEPPMVFHDKFYEDLKQSAREYFKGKGVGAHKMTTSHLALGFVTWVTMWSLIYMILVHDAMWAIPVVSCVSMYLAITLMHDASHNALVRSPMGNRILSHIAFPYGVNVSCWHIQHVMSHHIYTNEDADVDLFHFDPVITLKKGVNAVHIVLHCVRLLFVLSTAIPHLLLIVPYGMVFGQIDPAHGHRVYDRIKAIRSHRAELHMDIIVEMMMLLAFYVVCWYHHGLVKAVCVQMSIYTISSYMFCFFTQVSHLQEACFVDEKELKSLSFAKRQVAASMDFAADSALWGHISGGLNTQAIHHCFPSVSAMHLQALYPRFREVCKRHGVQLKEAPSLSSFVWGFVRFSN